MVEVCGSSPLTRGKLLGLRADRDQVGLIPAHAGKTAPRALAYPPAAAHPRSRGENVGTPGHEASETGSSPLTRGKRPRSRRQRGPSGLIPAHAGKTRPPDTEGLHHAAHPRSRGENARARGYKTMCMGSSPLPRGNPPYSYTARGRWRLIPAHAGKTGRQRAGRRSCTAHPRSRGENHQRRPEGTAQCGSSPLTRGKRCR